MNWKEEYQAAVGSKAATHRSDRALFVVEGKDAVTYLHGMITNDVKQLKPGKWMLASMLSHKGKLLSDFLVCREEDRFWIEVPKTAAENLFDSLKKFVLAAQVQLTEHFSDFSIFTLMGPQVTEAISDLPAFGEFGKVMIQKIPCLVAAGDEPVNPTFQIYVPAERSEDVQSFFVQSGVTLISDTAFEALRIERGIPKYGIDLDESHLLLEVPYLERTVSYTKGCYVGQETVARLHARGANVARRLMGIVSDSSSEEICVGTTVFYGDLEVGKTTSSCFSPQLEKPLALAFVHREAFTTGTKVTLKFNERVWTASILSLPLDSRTPNSR